MTIVGIDVGYKGAIVAYGKKVHSYPMPVIKGKRTSLDVRKIVNIFKEIMDNDKEIYVAIEKAGSRPGQGAPATFSFGYQAGFFEGLVSAVGIPYVLVRPQEWKKKMCAGLPNDKSASVIAMKRMFPQVDLRRTEKSKKDDDGIADALAIAVYADKYLV